MPGKRRKSERLLESALEGLAGALNESGAPWMIIGGIAIIARGVRRFTTDIDAAVRGDAVRPEQLLTVLARHDVVPRIEDAARFADANLVLLLRHEPTGVDLDVSFAWSAFEHDAIAACTEESFGDVRVPTCTAEDLVVFKALAGRPRDREDVQALLDLHPDLDVARVRTRVAELANLAEAPHLIAEFDTLTGHIGDRADVGKGAKPASKSRRARQSPGERLARKARPRKK